MKSMRIKILKNCAGTDLSFVSGEEAILSEELGADLVRAGYAMLLETIDDSLVNSESEDSKEPEEPADSADGKSLDSEVTPAKADKKTTKA